LRGLPSTHATCTVQPSASSKLVTDPACMPDTAAQPAAMGHPCYKYYTVQPPSSKLVTDPACTPGTAVQTAAM
jgi:hypothetical protein